MTSVHEQIITDTNNNNITRAAQQAAQGTKQNSKSVNSQAFLELLTMQLQYQDPTNPMDNSQMLAQEAQFSTLEQMEAISSTFSKFSNIYQANSYLGQTVEVNVDGKTTKGVVEYVDFSDSSGASISIDGKKFPLSSVSKVYPESQETTENRNFALDALEYIASGIGTIAQKFTEN